MSRHQETGHHAAAQDGSFSQVRNDRNSTGEEELSSDVDEPPDESIYIPRLSKSDAPINRELIIVLPHHQRGSLSLLTQALLMAPESAPWTDTEAPLLTSDGGLTSPTRTTTPSPPLPSSQSTSLAVLPSQKIPQDENTTASIIKSPRQDEKIGTPGEKWVEAGLGRQRCIAFARERQSSVLEPKDHAPAGTSVEPIKSNDPPKRPCMLRFVCPMKPSLEPPRKAGYERKQSSNTSETGRSAKLLNRAASSVSSNDHYKHSPTSTGEPSPKSRASTIPEKLLSEKPSISKPQKLELSEATSFHEFATTYKVEDPWTQEQTAPQQRITVQDTLRKENAIRRLAEEAKAEEALEEDEDRGVGTYHNDDDDIDSDDEISDGGNETDDEEGFADSDDDSDHSFQYQFWTPGITTAATSTDHLDHIRSLHPRVASVSSIESIINTREKPPNQESGKRRAHRVRRSPKPPKMRPGTPDLPDSTDFVCGTLDEDRPLEAAYMSCLEERRRSRHKVVPQDIDPSFPTSDLDDDDDDDAASHDSNEHVWVTGRPDNSDQDHVAHSRHGDLKKTKKSPMPSPKRLRSPPPFKRSHTRPSPTPHYLFNQSPVQTRCPMMHDQKPKSPPSSRRTSVAISPRQTRAVTMPPLAHRPNLTHTTSLPRTPNPFWRQDHQPYQDISDDVHHISISPKPLSPQGRDPHNRGPINIVKGLENKRRWRKEKYLRHQNRHGGKEKERRCQPGKGAERMRELGLEMADKVKGYGQKAELVLSV